MNDNQLDELLRGNVPRESPEARERALARLRVAIAQEAIPPAGGRRRLIGLVAAAAMAVTALVALQVVLPPGSGGPGVSAAQEIRRLGRLSARQEPLSPGPNEYIYSHSRELTKQSPGINRSDYDLAVEADVEFWISRDGSGQRNATVDGVNFVSELDRADWLEAGSPPLPQVGATPPVRYERGELTYFDVESLPTDPKELRVALDKGVGITNEEADVALLSYIGTILAQENLTPALRQSLFEVAATIPSVSVRGDATDQSGRSAVAVTATDVSGETSLFFDPSTAQLLGSSVDYPAADGHAAFTEWHVYLNSGIVSKVGDRPTS